MRQFWLVLAFVALAGLPASSFGAVSVGAVYGGNVINPEPLGVPATVTILCVGICPQHTAPDLAVSTRFWGIRNFQNCVVSTDGGVNWGNCATSPMTPAANTMLHIAGASDGSIIVMGQTDPTTCLVRRSTNGGTSWNTVFTNGSNSCGGFQNNGTRLKCRAGGICVFLGRDDTTLKSAQLYSTNSGASWTYTELLTAETAVTQFSLNDAGTSGAIFSGGFLGRTLLTDSGTLSATAQWSTISLGGCTGSYITDQRTGTCYTSPQPFTAYSTGGGLIKNLSLPGSEDGTNGGLSFGWDSTNLYIWTTRASHVDWGIWYSANNGTTFSSLFDSTGQAYTNQMSTIADVFKANGCIYFSKDLSPVFGKICP